jgi:hypothetical protein
LRFFTALFDFVSLLEAHSSIFLVGCKDVRKVSLTLAVICLFSPCARLAQAQVGPGMSGPLDLGSPLTFDAGPLGKLDLMGILSGMGVVQTNWTPTDRPSRWDLSNGQVFIQKTTGWWQFYLQAGAYNIPALGTPFLSTANTVSELFGPLPVGYLKLAPTKKFSILIGALSAILGDEYTFDFENMNIERGLLWHETNDVNRGVELNDSFGHFTGSLSWNDGYYSNRYTWLMGSLAYAFDSANSVTFIGGGNLGRTAFRSLATPVQNNGSLYDLIYTYTKTRWVIQPYFQYNEVPTDLKAGILHGAAARGGALLATYKFKHGFSMAGRAEYISTTGNVAEAAVNLLFGSGSSAWSITLTPTCINRGFFLRGEFSLVQARNTTPGQGFGPFGLNRTQVRGLLEAGFMF